MVLGYIYNTMMGFLRHQLGEEALAELRAAQSGCEHTVLHAASMCPDAAVMG